MVVDDAERATRTHPVPAPQLLAAMEVIIEQKRSAEFLREFAKAFVLASETDIADLRSFINRVTADPGNRRLTTAMSIVHDRC